MLKFSPANRKLKKLYDVESLQPYLTNNRKIYSFDLPAGYTCPAAVTCLAKAVLTKNGYRIKDGKDATVRCYAASEEVIFKAVRENRHKNLSNLKKNRHNLFDYICGSIPKNAGIIRIHSSGDFYNLKYFKTWLAVARHKKDILFYCYTKSALLWLHLNKLNVPNNFLITASEGGKYDTLIQQLGIRKSVIVLSEDEARQKGLEMDIDDSHASNPNSKDFALLVHGSQRKNTEAAKIVAAQRRIVASKKSSVD